MTVASEKDINEPKPKISPLRKALPQIIAVSVKNVLLFAFGMTLGFPTILIPSFSDSKSGESIVLDQEAISWIGSVNLLCVPLGCLLSGVITQPLGRRRAMQLVNIPFLAAWLLFHYASAPWHVFLALCITGFSGGLLEAPVLTYVAEITEPNIRGALSSTSTMSVNLGILTSYFLGTFLQWRSIALINATIPFVAFVLLTLIAPESPYWLISKNRLEEAKKSLAWLRGWTTEYGIEEEFNRIADNLEKNPMNKNWMGKGALKEQLKLYLKPTFLKPFALISLCFCIGHFGNTPVAVFSVNIFASFGVSISPYTGTVCLGAAQLLAVLTCVLSIKFLGKRRLVAISLLGVAVTFFTTALYSFLTKVDYSYSIAEQHQGSNSWIPLCSVVASAYFSYLCIKTLPWILIGELFNNDVRSIASGVTAALGYVFGFLANKTFLNIVDLAGLSGVFWLYSFIAAVGLVVLYFVLPETEGRTLEDIFDHYAGRGTLDNRVQRVKRVGKQSSGVEMKYCGA